MKLKLITFNSLIWSDNNAAVLFYIISDMFFLTLVFLIFRKMLNTFEKYA